MWYIFERCIFIFFKFEIRKISLFQFFSFSEREPFVEYHPQWQKFVQLLQHHRSAEVPFGTIEVQLDPTEVSFSIPGYKRGHSHHQWNIAEFTALLSLSASSAFRPKYHSAQLKYIPIALKYHSVFLVWRKATVSISGIFRAVVLQLLHRSFVIVSF